MTENKRFKHSITLQGEDEIWDTQTDVYFRVCGALDRLNEFNEENQRVASLLQSERRELIEQNNNYRKLLNELKDENKELKAFKEKVFERINGEIDSVKESCNVLMTSDEAEAIMDTLIELKNELSGEIDE